MKIGLKKAKHAKKIGDLNQTCINNHFEKFNVLGELSILKKKCLVEQTVRNGCRKAKGQQDILSVGEIQIENNAGSEIVPMSRLKRIIEQAKSNTDKKGEGDTRMVSSRIFLLTFGSWWKQDLRYFT